MIKVTIELWPMGNEARKQNLGEIIIANDATGSNHIGNYWFKLMKSARYAKTAGVWKKGEVKDFPRTRLGPYDLLYRVLREAVGVRNK